MRFWPVSLCVFCILLVTVAGFSAAAPGKGVDFNRDIRPILSDNCFSCHGPDVKGRMAGLRLDTRDGVLGKAPSIVARITHEKKGLRMPPVATGRTLNEKQIALIKK